MRYLKKILLYLICFISIIYIIQNYNQNNDEYIQDINIDYKLYNDSINNLTFYLLEKDTLTNINYMHGWDNPRINCYTDVEIPLTSKIDVSKFSMPVNGRVTSKYGYRSKFGRMHYGIDLSLKTGDTVRAAFDGVVRIVNYDDFGYGKYVVIRHNNGVETVYAHLSKHLVKREQLIRAGEPIGLGGSTGRGTNSHLHFEIRFLGLALNPSAIVDFKKGIIHQEIYIFNKKSYQKVH